MEYSMSIDRRATAILGLLVGDALGVPYEFHAAKTLEGVAIDMYPPVGFRRSHISVAPGTYSDDGAQALCLLDSLVRNGGFDLNDFADSLIFWWKNGTWAVDGHVFDIGTQTSRALQRNVGGCPPLESGPKDANDNGNGSLMRCLPIALYFDNIGDILFYSAQQSIPTHGNITSQMCCGLYNLWAFYIRRGLSAAFLREDANVLAQRAWEMAINDHKALFNAHPDDSVAERNELDRIVAYVDSAELNGRGYVLDTLTVAVRTILSTRTYRDAVLACVRLGDDTDTTAAVTGGIAGLLYGIGGERGIPAEWLKEMKGMAPVAVLLSKAFGETL
jgi:ADP-ribosyl-[dinitrogen reductase] hydrolase